MLYEVITRVQMNAQTGDGSPVKGMTRRYHGLMLSVALVAAALGAIAAYTADT